MAEKVNEAIQNLIAGRYEVAGVILKGIQQDNNVYQMQIDEITFEIAQENYETAYQMLVDLSDAITGGVINDKSSE